MIWAAGAYLSVYLCWQVFGWGGEGRKALIGDLAFVPLYCTTAAMAWLAARRCAEVPRLRSAWRLIAVGVVFYLLGLLFQTYYEIFAGSKPYPSLADPAYLAFYPFAFTGLLRLTRVGETRSQRVRALIDCATLAIAGGAVVWDVVLGPATLATGKPLQTLITIAYPVGDLILIAGLATALLRRAVPASAGPLRIAAIGLAFFVGADLVYGSASLNGTYSGGDPVDALYMVAAGLFLAAAQTQRRPRGSEELSDTPGVRRTSLVPWVGVALVFALVGVADRHQKFVPTGGLLAAAFAVTLLVALRQLFAQRELLHTHRELELAHAELAALATIDPVTLLPNHRALAASVEQEVARSQRVGSRCAVVFFDIDHFKALNDILGHTPGDVALREVGVVARSCLREVDTVGRWGGEEFVVLLPDTGSAAGMVATERLRRAIAAHGFAGAAQHRLTCSLGIAVYPDDGRTRAELIDSADRAMYAAKRFGRNQAFAAADPAVAALKGYPRPKASRDEDALAGAVEALALLVDERDSYTNTHATDVAELSRRLALELRCDPAETSKINNAARLHDIGKVAVPDAILVKPGHLTEGEWTLIRKHTVVGGEVLSRIPALRPIASLVRGHHEHWDGTGYPDGLAGEDIPLGARVISVADAFTAMVTARPYSAAIDPYAALAEIVRCSGTQFDADVVTAFEAVLAPCETVAARLSSGLREMAS